MTQVQFPVSIGVAGAPGSGKTQLGEMFYEIAHDYFEDNDSELWIIENAGKTIEQDFDYAMGVFGSYADDLRAYHRRQEAENLARAKGVSFLSLGTAIDHMAHTGINLEAIMTGLSTPDQEIKAQQGQLTMAIMTHLFRDHFRYTFGFYLPHPGTSVILPGQSDSEDEYNKRIDAAIRMVFANLGIRIQILDEPTMEEKAQEMFDTVLRIMENGPDPVPEPVAEEVPTSEDSTLTSDAELPE